MATLYWGGGTGTWDGFTTANWYTDFARLTLSARAPSAEDDVIFDSVSSAIDYTVTLAGNTSVCRNVTIAGPATGNLTLAGTGTWYIYGSLSFPAAGLIRTFTAQIQFWGAGNHTITTNGVTLASTTIFAGSGTYTLQDALNSGSSTINFNAGTLDTNGNNFTCGTITAAFGSAGTLTLGASTVSAATIVANTSITINAGTSNITLSAATASIGNGAFYTGNTFNNVTFSSNAITTSSFYGNNTFNNLTFTTRSSFGISNVVLFGNQTVTGTLTIAGQSSVNRYFVRSDTIGTPRTLTVGTVAALTDVDFRDITVAGASAPWSGTQLGDCGGNTNITFTSPKTVYWNNVAGGAWSDTAWATSSGGAVSAANFPLAQDTAIIDNTGLNTGSSITGFNGYNLGTLTSTKTNAFTLAGTNPILYGNLTLTASTTATSFSPVFSGRVTQNLTSAGNTLNGLNCAGFGASVRLVGATTVTSWTITSGGLDTNNQNFTCSSLNFSTLGLPFTLTLGSSSFTTPNLGAASELAPVMTVSAGTSTITIANGSGNVGFAGQTLTWNNVTFSLASSSGRVFYGNNTFNNLTYNVTPTSVGVATTTLNGNITVTGTFALGGGTNVTQRMGLVSGTIGTQRTITAATVTGLRDIDFRDINATGAANWTTGTRLGNCGGNTGITFPAPKTVYWNLAGTQDWSATAWATGSGGSPAANNFPLAQDTAVFDNAGSVDTVTMQAFNIGTISAGSRTSAMTLIGNGAPSIYGDVTYGSGVTPSNTGAYTFSGRGTQTYTTAGKSVARALNITKPLGTTFRHGDAYTGGGVTVNGGNYDTQNYNISATQFGSSNSSTRSITLGTSTLTLSATLPLTFATSTGLTFSGASSTINLSSTGAKTFAGGGLTFGTVSSTGGTTNALTITGSNTFGTLTNSARTFMIWTAGTTQEITNFTYTGDVSNVVRWYTSIPGQRATIKQSATGGSLAAVGANSVDGGNNSGLTFTGTSPDYFYVKDIAYSPFSSFNTSNFFAFF